MLAPPTEKEPAMDVNPFLDYLRDHEATRDLADRLREVLALRNRTRMIPAEVSARTPQRVAS
jgi:hypothetical protein